MYYSLVCFPQIDTAKINDFRSKYDPHCDLIDAHFTIVFPVPDSLGREKLIEHIKNTLLTQRSFDIHISGLEKSWDNWLFLVLQKGKEEMIKLHDDLYGGLLSEFLRSDIEFIPHIAIGLFTMKAAGYDLKDPKALAFDEEVYKVALEEAAKENFDYTAIVNKLSLVEINDDFTKTAVIHEFELQQ